jgi:hypothetical protein
MAVNINNHDPIFPIETISGNTEYTNGSTPELAGQTYKRGVPVQITTGGTPGFLQVWDGATVAAGIAGVSLQIGSNLGTNGQGAPSQGFGQVTGTKAIQTWGSVQFQPNAVNIAEGTPATDGRALFAVAQQDTIFKIQVDNTNGTVPADYTPTLNAMIGKSYGITFDASNQAFLDIAKATPGTNTVFEVLEYDQIDGNQVNGHVHGRFILAAQQLGS